ISPVKFIASSPELFRCGGVVPYKTPKRMPARSTISPSHCDSMGAPDCGGQPTALDRRLQGEDDIMHSDVLISGAGPTGLVLALWLTKLGVEVRIVDKTAEPGTTSRALAVQARTLELYRQLDLADFVIEHGHKVPAVNMWVKGEPKARLPFETVGEDL